MRLPDHNVHNAVEGAERRLTRARVYPKRSMFTEP
jgi:hypothetical protein